MLIACFNCLASLIFVHGNDAITNFGRNNMKTNTELGNAVTEDLVYTFANLMGVGWPPEVIKHKMGLSNEMLQAVAQAYFNQSK